MTGKGGSLEVNSKICLDDAAGASGGGTMIVDILILLIVFGLVGFVLYRKWKNRKVGGCGCGCCKDCPKVKRGVEFKE